MLLNAIIYILKKHYIFVTPVIIPTLLVQPKHNGSDVFKETNVQFINKQIFDCALIKLKLIRISNFNDQLLPL